jgi:hypothetical protein
MGKYTVEDYLNEMDIAEAEEAEEENEDEEDTEDVEESVKIDEGLKVLEQNFFILLGEAENLSEEEKKKLKERIAGAYKSAKAKVTAKAGAAKAAVGKKLAAGKAAVVAKAGVAKAAVGKKATAAKEFAKTKKGKAVIGGVGLAAALGGGALAYRKYFGKAAKACKDKKGAEKAACMKKFRAGATEAAIMALQDSSSHCDNSKNPEKCYSRVNEAIEQLRANLDVLREG